VAIELSSLTFTHQADIVPLFGTAEIINTGTANALNGDDRITATGGLFGLVTGLPLQQAEEPLIPVMGTTPLLVVLLLLVAVLV